MAENYRPKNEYLVGLLNEYMPSADFSINHMMQIGSRLVRKGESIDVSPQLTPKALNQWLHAYVDAIELYREFNR